MSGYPTYQELAGHWRTPGNIEWLARCNPGELQRLILSAGPDEGESVRAILPDFMGVVLPRFTHWNHPSFHAFFSVSPSGPGILGELLTAALNVNVMLWNGCYHPEYETRGASGPEARGSAGPTRQAEINNVTPSREVL